ncbi:MAG: hypothetical protein MZU97_07650 [Bacillus subtilis]|nr:hypothetical protein [Bacillus subtilis]
MAGTFNDWDPSTRPLEERGGRQLEGHLLPRAPGNTSTGSSSTASGPMTPAARPAAGTSTGARTAILVEQLDDPAGPPVFRPSSQPEEDRFKHETARIVP